MKVAEVILLYKGKEKDNTVNYRPILLLMTISKLLEKLIYKRVHKFLEKYGVFYQSQYRFHNQHSCRQAITELIGKLLQAKEAGLQSASIFLDLLKAFDMLDHQVLLEKLEIYGIRGTANTWFASYLHNRSLKVKVTTKPGEVTYSSTFSITYGTTQGSCLGPLLFIVFCNDVQLLSLFGSLILLADDTTLTNSHRSEKFLQYVINHDLV